MEEKAKNRLHFLDALRGLAILLVVWGHSGGDNYFFTLIYYIHIPMFLIITGCTLYLRKDKITPTNNIIRLVKSILYPYIGAALFYVIWSFLDKYAFGNNANIHDILIRIVLLDYGTAWYLPALFFGEILAIIIIWILNQKKDRKEIRKGIPVILILILGELLRRFFYINYSNLRNIGFIDLTDINKTLKMVLLISLLRCVYFALFILVGFILYPYLLKISPKIKRKNVVYLLGFLVALLFIDNNSFFPEIHYIDWKNTFIYVFLATASCSAILILFMISDRRMPFLEYLGGVSLEIMIIHEKVINITDRIIPGLINDYHLDLLLNGTFYSIFNCLVVLFITLIIVEGIKKVVPCLFRFPNEDNNSDSLFYKLLKDINRLQNNNKKLIEAVTLCCIGIYLIDLATFSTAGSYRFDSTLDTYLFTIMFILASIKIGQKLVNKDYKRFVEYIIIIIICGLSYVSSSYNFIPWLSIVVIAVSDIDYHKLIDTYLIFMGLFLLTVICESQIGSIENLVYYSSGRLRSSWGIAYTTDFASYCLFLASYLWIKLRKVNELYSLIPAFVSLYISIYIADSNTSSFCSAILMFFILFDVIRNILKDKYSLIKYKKIFDGFLILVFPLCTIFIFVMLYLYHLDLPIAKTIDTFMHYRISLAHSAIHTYGIRPFGSFFNMIGAGGSTFTTTFESYNFIDDTYALLLIRYGWVILILISILWTVVMKKMLACNNYRIALVMVLIAIHSISEHHFPELNFNILLALPFAYYGKEEAKEDKNANKAFIITFVLISMLACVCVPIILTILRTYVSLHVFDNNTLWNTPSFLALTIMLSISLTIHVVYRVLFNMFLHKKTQLYYACLIGAIATVGILFADIYLELKEYYHQYKPLLKQEEVCIEIIKENKQGDLYSSAIPLFYEKYFGGIKSGLKQNDELAKETGATIIVDASYDSNILTQFGYKWIEMSNEHAIYTNDENVINALQNNGYAVYTTNIHVNRINLEDEALLNNIVINNQGGIMINENNELLMGPYINLHTGRYVLNFKLSNPKIINNNENKEIGKISIKAYAGQTILSEKIIYLNEFDEDFNYIGSLNFTSYEYMNIEFIFESIDGNGYTIRNLSYNRTFE